MILLSLSVHGSFSYDDLVSATNNFSEKEQLGEGGFGSVYRGFLQKLNCYVAVKKLSRDSKQGTKEFASEVKIISQLRHRNIVQLMGWCHERKELLLVYEFMANGSLDSHLFKENRFLTWEVRYNIARGLAYGLLYLHQEGVQYVVHRDIKAGNIMLDSNFNAKIGDFGLARLGNHGKLLDNTTMAGTIGYVAPEYATSGRASKESDVYSFGVVLLEIACGRKNINLKAIREDQINLREWVWDLYGRRNILEAIDPRLNGEFDKQQAECVMIVGLWCAHPDANLRPVVEKAVQVLNFVAPLPHLPSKMPFATYVAWPSMSFGGTDLLGSQKQPVDKEQEISKLTLDDPVFGLRGPMESFRTEGTDGEFDRICRSLGLSGSEDFAIPAAAWEAMKIRSASVLLPRPKLYEADSPRIEEKKEQHQDLEQQEREFCVRVSDSIRISEATKLTLDDPGEPTKFAKCSDVTCAAGGGNKGARPPSLKPPPSMTLPGIDDTCSTWDLLRDFAPENNRESLTMANRDFSSDDEEDGPRKHGLEVAAAIKREEEEDNLLRIASAVLSESCSSTTSNDDGSSSTTAEPTSNISPNGRFRRISTCWVKGELLGRGSFGSVYEGISDDGFFFAVKEVSLLDQGSQGKQSLYQLEQEIALLSQLEHENIVQYYGTDKDDSKLYIFLELVTKGSLTSLYQRYHLRDSQVSAYTRQILIGLKFLHDRGVVHRDIKCANILVDANGSVKLADFGLAKAAKLNDVKSCKGTAFWMAPEVVNRKNQGYGLPADMWSLGCTVLEMLTGQIPYSHLECMQALFRIGRGVPPPVPDSLSQDGRDLILQCLQVNPNDRPTAAQLLEHPFVRRPLSASSGSASPYSGQRS